MTSPRLLTGVEVQHHLKVSRTTLWRLVRDGRLPAVRVGRAIRFRQRDVNRYIEATNIPKLRAKGG